MDSVVEEFDIDIVDGVFPQKGMIQNDFYDNDLPGKFEVLPYIDGEILPQALRNDISRKKINNLLKNIG